MCSMTCKHSSKVGSTYKVGLSSPCACGGKVFMDTAWGQKHVSIHAPPGTVEVLPPQSALAMATVVVKGEGVTVE